MRMIRIFRNGLEFLLLISVQGKPSSEWNWDIVPANPTEADTLVAKMIFFSKMSVSIESEHYRYGQNIVINVKVVTGNMTIIGWFGHTDTLGTLPPNIYSCTIHIDFFHWDWIEGKAIYIDSESDSYIFEVQSKVHISNDSGHPNAATYLLYQNYPNPFNSDTKISYVVPKSGLVQLKLFNIVGHELSTIREGFHKAGDYCIPFNASAFPSGVYIYRLFSDNICIDKTMAIVK